MSFKPARVNDLTFGHPTFAQTSCSRPRTNNRVFDSSLLLLTEGDQFISHIYPPTTPPHIVLVGPEACSSKVFISGKSLCLTSIIKRLGCSDYVLPTNSKINVGS